MPKPYPKKPMKKAASEKQFAKGAKVHPKNNMTRQDNTGPMRGGIRL